MPSQSQMLGRNAAGAKVPLLSDRNQEQLGANLVNTILLLQCICYGSTNIIKVEESRSPPTSLGNYNLIRQCPIHSIREEMRWEHQKPPCALRINEVQEPKADSGTTVSLGERWR